MIQLIGILLAVYMFIRGLDILSRVEDRKSRKSTVFANLSGWIAIFGAVIFFTLLLAQADPFSGLQSSGPGG